MKSFLFYLKSRRQRIDLVVYFIWLLLKEFFKVSFIDKKEIDGPKIDVLIPTATKDYPLLADVLLSLKNIYQPLNKIYVVSPDTKEIRAFCQNNNCLFIDEKEVLPYGKNAIAYKVGNVDRSGWLYQQLLKLSGDKFVEQDNYFVIDADTLLVNKINLIENHRFVFFQNKEWNNPYFVTFKKLFGYRAINKLSFTSHMMIFNKKMLEEMKREIETKYGQSWDKVYISMADPKEASCISDYDTYANWVLIHHPEFVLQKPLYNKGLSRSKLRPFAELEKIYNKNYKTISFHSYIS